MKRFPGNVTTWVVAALILIGAGGSTAHVQKYTQRADRHDTLYLPSGGFLKELSLGYREVVSDMVWFSAIQYYGDYRHGNHDLVYFKSLMDIITELDPHFISAYQFGALVLCEDVGAFEDGMSLLKRGMAKNPTAWELPFEIGFLNFINRVSMDTAAEYFDLASRLPGAPEVCHRFAAYVYSQAGRSGSAIHMWEQYKEHTEDPFLRELAQRYIEKIKQEQQGLQEQRGRETSENDV